MNEQALKDRLLVIAKEKGIHFNQCWKKLLLERFLTRLSRSSEKEKIIFKGGFLLSYLYAKNVSIKRRSQLLPYQIRDLKEVLRDHGY